MIYQMHLTISSLDYLLIIPISLPRREVIKEELETLVNIELSRVKEWWNSNKLSINFSKTNSMIVKSARKEDMQIDIKIPNRNDLYVSRKDHIKVIPQFCIAHFCCAYPKTIYCIIYEVRLKCNE